MPTTALPSVTSARLPLAGPSVVPSTLGVGAFLWSAVGTLCSGRRNATYACCAGYRRHRAAAAMPPGGVDPSRSATGPVPL